MYIRNLNKTTFFNMYIRKLPNELDVIKQKHMFFYVNQKSTFVCFSCLASSTRSLPSCHPARLRVSLDPVRVPHGSAAGPQCDLPGSGRHVCLHTEAVGAPVPVGRAPEPSGIPIPSPSREETTRSIGWWRTWGTRG